MPDRTFRTLLAFSLMFVLAALMGLMSLSSPALKARAMRVETPEPPTPFSERLEQAGSIQALAGESSDGWVAVSPGVDYQLFQLPDPNNVHVARMDRSFPSLFLESSIGQGRLTGGVERVSDMSARYEGAINYWGQSWGQTSDVIVAINGSFFDDSGIPDRGLIHGGWYARRFNDYENGSGLAWKLDGTVFVGECVAHLPNKQLITYLSSSLTNKFHGINTARGSDELIIYTPQYDRSTQTDDSGLEVLVEMVRPMLVLPQPSMALGTVHAILDQQGDTPIPFDHVVLSATGTMRTKLLANLQVGDVIGISNSITSYADDDCTTPVSMDWTKTYAAVGGSYYFLENGVINSFSDPGATLRNPRTAIAFDAAFVYFIVVDGRDPGVSVGMTVDELALFARDTLGADYAINQDGGGSSTMVIDGVVVNTPSDLTPGPCTDFAYLPLLLNQPQGSAPAPPAEPLEPLTCMAHTERPVANGMMMVAAQPMSASSVFSPGQAITNPAQATVYLGPGDNYAELGSVPAASEGTILLNAAGLDGVYAKGEYWWQVDFGALEGWVAESALAAGP